jgi:hypothetical protein
MWEKTVGVIRNDNPETMTKLGTPYTGQRQAEQTNTTSPLGTLGSIVSLWEATLYQVKGNHFRIY